MWTTEVVLPFKQWTQDIGQLPESTLYAARRDDHGDDGDDGDDDGMIIFVWEMCPRIISQTPYNRMSSFWAF